MLVDDEGVLKIFETCLRKKNFRSKKIRRSWKVVDVRPDVLIRPHIQLLRELYHRHQILKTVPEKILYLIQCGCSVACLGGAECKHSNSRWNIGWKPDRPRGGFKICHSFFYDCQLSLGDVSSDHHNLVDNFGGQKINFFEKNRFFDEIVKIRQNSKNHVFDPGGVRNLNFCLLIKDWLKSQLWGKKGEWWAHVPEILGTKCHGFENWTKKGVESIEKKGTQSIPHLFSQTSIFSTIFSTPRGEKLSFSRFRRKS